ncbi:MAG: AAA family ATPase [Myxococcota bacterium]
MAQPPEGSPGGPTAADKAGVAALLGSWLGLLKRHRGMALAAGFVTLTPFVLFGLFALPSYSSSGVVQVANEGSSPVPMLELMGELGGSQVETEVEILRRREAVVATFSKLGLHVIDPNRPFLVTTDWSVASGKDSPTPDWLASLRETISIAHVSPERFKGLQVSIEADGEAALRVSIGEAEQATTYATAVGEVLEAEGLTLSFRDVPVEPGASATVYVETEGEMLERLLPQLQVAPVGARDRSTDLVAVRFTHADRFASQAVVDDLMRRYLAQSLDWQATGASKSAEFIRQRLADADAELADAEQKLREFSEAEHAVQLDTQARVTIENVAMIEAELRQAEVEANVLGSLHKGLKTRLKDGQGAYLTASFVGDPVLSASIAALTENETRLATLSATLTNDHPKLRETQRQIARQRREVQRLLGTARKNVGSRVANLERERDSAAAALTDFPAKNLQLARYMRDVEVSQKLYAFLLERYREAEILEASTTIDKRIVESAHVPHDMASPRRGRIWASGLAAALFAAVAAAWLSHALRRRLQSVDDVASEFDFGVYGVVPMLDEGRKADRKDNARLPHTAIWAETHSPAAEAFRALCVSVTLTPAEAGRGRIIALSSSQQGEGKSTVVSNLAVSLARAGSKVLVIDLDLRRPVQHREWRSKRDGGFTNLLAAGDMSCFGDYVRSQDCGVDVLTAGQRVPDSLPSLMSPKLPELLELARAQYDYVLLDSAPSFVPDGSVVAQHADLLLVVARPGVLERAHARRARVVWSRLSAPKGLVLNAVERNHGGDDGYYYYGGGYAYASEYGQNDAPAEDDDDHDDVTAVAS